MWYDTDGLLDSLYPSVTIRGPGSIDVYDTVNLTVSLPSFVTIDGVGSHSFSDTKIGCGSFSFLVTIPLK